MINQNKQFTASEIRQFKKLNTPSKVQDFLNRLAINFEDKGPTCMSPRRVLRAKKAHCLEGALFAASALAFHGRQPLILDLRPYEPDECHVVALFQEGRYFGAISKTNHAVLRFREPVYKTVRELVMSYFHEYFLDNGRKTLYDYAGPVNLSRFDKKNWQTDEHDLFYISKYLDTVKHRRLLTPGQERGLRKADPIEIAAGKLVGQKRREPRKS